VPLGTSLCRVHSASLIRSAVLSSLSLSPVRGIGTERQAEAVPLEAGYNVQVNVEYLLAGRLAVGQEEIYLLAPEAACIKRCALEA
jgi:hypothetical protein